LVDVARRAHLEVITKRLADMALFEDFLPRIDLEYRSGWDVEVGLGAHLRRTLGADREARGTGAGPHRADLRVMAEGRVAASFLSRGQQKALAVALLLAQIIVVDAALGRSLVVLVDDLPSELDDTRLQASVAVLRSVQAQVMATALHRGILPEALFDCMFHVKQGRVTQVV
jgi:DNA replication and repair protein RecF